MTEPLPLKPRDQDLYNRGRQDARSLLHQFPGTRKRLIETIRAGEYREIEKPCPYWERGALQTAWNEDPYIKGFRCELEMKT